MSMTVDDEMSSIQLAIDDQQSPVVVRMSGSLTRHTVSEAFTALRPYFDTGRAVTIDVGQITEIDSTGVALFSYGLRKLGSGSGGCSLRAAQGEVAAALRMIGQDLSDSGLTVGRPKVGVLESMGEILVQAGEAVYFFLFLVSEVFYHGVVSPFKGERPRFAIFIEQMSRLGAGSAPIVLLVSLLVGLTTAFQSAYQLRQFGANIYVADVIAISMMVELGPLMAAILVAGRSGSAITAEIGTMQVAEEIDALRLIGINPVQYLAVPRIYAVVITQALLGISAAVVGTFGGFVIAVSYLDLSPAAFFNEAVSSLVMGDLFHNLSKSMVFGFIIVSVGVFYGLRVSGGAAGVGKATTNSVVMSIFLIIVADCIYSFL